MFNDHPQIAPEGYGRYNDNLLDCFECNRCTDIPLACCGSLLYVYTIITAWVCDICQVAAFGTLDEAERHEESCDNTHIPIGKSTDWESLPTQSTNNQGGNNLSYTQGGDTEQGSNAYSDNSIHGMTILCPSVTKTAVDSKGPSFWDNNINNNKDDCTGDHKNNSSNVNKSDDTDTNTDKTEESIEAIKQSILGLGLSMYNIDRGILLSRTRNTIRPVRSLSTFPNENSAMVVNNLCQDLSCPICHDRLTNPASLLCGHSFCITCLDWWLNFQHQHQHQYQQCNSGMSGRGGNEMNKNGRGCTAFSCLVTCPLCGKPIVPATNSNNRGECKPKVQVNTALKAALEKLMDKELNSCKLDVN